MNCIVRKKGIVPAVILTFIAIILGAVHFANRPSQKGIDTSSIPVVMNHREGCIICHDEMTGFSDSHDPQILGCSGCHLGDPLSADKDKAHEGLILVAGNLDTAELTCGQSGCHQSQVPRVLGSLMASGKGMVSVNRFVFQETATPDGPGHLSHLADSAADTHLRQLCVTCHLNFPKNTPSPHNELSRGGGCLACHLEYSESARSQLETYQQTGELPSVHPALNTVVDDDRCFGCHSRSARISLNYQGYMETTLKAKNLDPQHSYRILQDQRVVEYKGADIHYQKGMVCIDCHTVRDTMGDGEAYNHQGEQVEISCEDCHTREKPAKVEFSQLDEDSRKILRLRQQEAPSDQYAVSKRSAGALNNVTLDDQLNLKFRGKLDKVKRQLNPPAKDCAAIQGHDRLTCQACHTSWTPVCVNCHTQFEPDKTRTDHYTGTAVQGAWMEYRGILEALPPALGIRVDKRSGEEQVSTFIPGMVLTIHGIKENKPDKDAIPGKPGSQFQIFQRLFSPTSAHTIRKESQTCNDCHWNSWRLGLGLGELARKSNGPGKIPTISFIPERSNHQGDGLPRDAWTGFLENRSSPASTRTGARPFNKEEQTSILTVGWCLTCHEPTEDEISRIYNQFDWALNNRPDACYGGL